MKTNSVKRVTFITWSNITTFIIQFMQALVNVAGTSARQLRRKIQEKGFQRNTSIQVHDF